VAYGWEVLRVCFGVVLCPRQTGRSCVGITNFCASGGCWRREWRVIVMMSACCFWGGLRGRGLVITEHVWCALTGDAGVYDIDDAL